MTSDKCVKCGSTEIISDVDGTTDKVYVYCAKCLTLKSIGHF